MSLLTTEELGLSFGAFDLFQGISVSVANDSKIGLIGPNGIGKTSLLLLLAGLKQPSAGRVNIARGRQIGYLRQESVEAFAARNNTVYAEMETVFAYLQEQQQRLHEMEAAMAAGDYDEDLLERYGDLQQVFEKAGGYDYDVRIQRTLQGLGLGKDSWEMPLTLLSGGQQTRALLARLLLEQPDLLILDEPTNHLDTEAITWLERTLREWEGAVLVVSHDRYFLDNVVDTIWEMSRSCIETYRGNYSAYLQQRQDRWEYHMKVFKEEKERLLKEVDFIQRNWVRASTHDRAMGLLRRLSRDLAVVENYGILALRSGKNWGEMNLRVRPMEVIEAIRFINALQPPNERPALLKLKLQMIHSSGNIVLSSQGVRVGYPQRALFDAPALELRRGECVALIGPNGTGKTTFLKTLLGQVAPLSGSLHLGASLKIGYFAQAHDALNSEHTVMEALLEKRQMPVSQARNHLARYLFRGEDVFKPVSALSGGERGRLALALLSLDGANFLLLDEPTNHLDIPAQEALQEVLEDFAGTILLVTHDRYLIDRLATQIWDLRGSKLLVYKGTYREYIAAQASSAEQARALQAADAVKVQAIPSNGVVAGGNGRPTGNKHALAVLEERIHRQEKALHKLTRELEQAGDGESFDRLHQLSWRVAQAQSDLEYLVSEWERLAV
jgi:ATP-binding cassette subfamily F protein 3